MTVCFAALRALLNVMPFLVTSAKARTSIIKSTATTVSGSLELLGALSLNDDLKTLSGIVAIPFLGFIGIVLPAGPQPEFALDLPLALTQAVLVYFLRPTLYFLSIYRIWNLEYLEEKLRPDTIAVPPLDTLNDVLVMAPGTVKPLSKYSVGIKVKCCAVDPATRVVIRIEPSFTVM